MIAGRLNDTARRRETDVFAAILRAYRMVVLLSIYHINTQQNELFGF